MQTLMADVADCWRRRRRLLRGAQPAAARHQTVIVCKGLGRKSGASLFAGNLVISGRLLGNTEEQARNTAEFLIKYHNQFLIDQDWARRCGDWIETVYYPELEEARSLFQARRRRTCRHQSRQDPKRRRQRAGQLRRARSWTCGESRSSGPAFRGWRKPSQRR